MKICAAIDKLEKSTHFAKDQITHPLHTVDIIAVNVIDRMIGKSLDDCFESPSLFVLIDREARLNGTLNRQFVKVPYVH